MAEQSVLPTIRVCDVTKTYRLYRSPADRLKETILRRPYGRDVVALQHASLSVAPGEILGVVGPNGAGKTTLLKLIAGISKPTSGAIERHGRVTGVLALGTGFNLDLTGTQNAITNAQLLGMSAKETQTRLPQIIEFAELGEFMGEPMKSYSSGMLMRLAFSVAIHSEPTCFLIDEALAVGDAHFQQKCFGRIRDFQASGGAIVFVSHDLNAIRRVCSRAVLLRAGEVLEQGSPETVVNAYYKLIAGYENQSKPVSNKSGFSGSYGSLAARIHSVDVVGEHSDTNAVSSGEVTTVTVAVEAQRETPEVTIGILIRDRFGQDVFGTNTHQHNLKVSFKAGERCVCRFRMAMNLGPGRYTVTAAIHTGETHLDDCIHWADHACDLEVVGITGPRFSGLCRLSPEIDIRPWEEINRAAKS
ncbi:MAG: ABC transporter [Deltaproteobacteria bacterium RIFOXYA12_FULL_58_15]|nr:MAG: ABC transporter [Deltaproteobacteria bacterium RIFOXYA12_FULL_58_15]OGR09447.1 MAG: ABC transporter [Deltaproteobacteria bacterium RIFOXYB12_FULL_58_9]